MESCDGRAKVDVELRSKAAFDTKTCFFYSQTRLRGRRFVPTVFIYRCFCHISSFPCVTPLSGTPGGHLLKETWGRYELKDLEKLERLHINMKH